MIRLYDNIQFPDTHGRFGWVDAPVEYSQWIEYKGKNTYVFFYNRSKKLVLTVKYVV